MDLPATAAHVSAATGSLVCAITSGLVKEFVDYQDNKAMPGMHGVEAWDAVATAAPGLALAAALLAIAANAEAWAIRLLFWRWPPRQPGAMASLPADYVQGKWDAAATKAEREASANRERQRETEGRS